MTIAVINDGEKSTYAQIEYGGPQRSVEDPILFQYYINDITVDLISIIRLFAYYTIIAYMVIQSNIDAKHLQPDLYKLHNGKGNEFTSTHM